MSKQPTRLSEKRRIYVFYWNVDTDSASDVLDNSENYVITDDLKQAQEWANGGGRVVEYARGGFVKDKTVAKTG